MTERLVVRGAATPEEVAAVLALLARPSGTTKDAYARWRTVRRAALRRDSLGNDPVRPA